MPNHTPKSLGHPKHIFRYPPLGWKDVLFLILPGTVGVCLPLWFGFSRFRMAQAGYGPVAANLWSRPWYTLAVIALVVFIFISIARIRRAWRFVAVHEQGLRLSLKQTQSLRWEEIAGVSMETTRYHLAGIQLRLAYSGVLYPNAGKPIALPGAIQNLPELLTLIKARLYPRLLPHLQANLESGQWLYFGPIAIQKEGIQISGKGTFDHPRSVDWSQVVRMNILSGYLVVELSDNTTHKLPVSKIPNIELLLQLIQTGVNP